MATSTAIAPIPTDILYETIIALEDRAIMLRVQVYSDAHEDIKTIARRQLARVETSLAYFRSIAE